MPAYYYRDIGDDLTTELCHHLERGDSVVMLGPRGVGKRYAVELIKASRTRRGLPPLVVAGFGGEKLLLTEQSLASVLGTACGLGPNLVSLEAWEREVTATATDQMPILLAATNVDGMTKGLAHRFLTTVNKLVKVRRLIVLATGESNLYDLVDDGPNSAFNCAHQFVVHAHDPKHFRRFLSKRMRQFRLRFPRSRRDADLLFGRIYELTGGDVSLLRAVLWSLTDSLNFHRHRPRALPVILQLGDLPEHLGKEHIVPTAGLVPFLHATQCILSAAQEPYPFTVHTKRPKDTILHTLEELLAGNDFIVRGEKPHILELAGLARRDSRQRLGWFSAYGQKFARHFFTPQRLGDLHAFAHEWDQAFKCYAQIDSPEEKRRPLSEDDRVTLMHLIDGLAVDFHRRVSESAVPTKLGDTFGVLEELEQGLGRALEHLLGFESKQVTFWNLDIYEKWTSTTGASAPESLLRDWTRLRDHPGDAVLEETLSGHYASGYHWVLCRGTDNRPTSAVLVDGRDDPMFYHEMRQSAIYRVFRAYRRARERFVMNQGLRTAAGHRAAEAEIARAFWNLTSAKTWYPEEALGFIAQPLIKNLSSVGRLLFAAFDGAPDGNLLLRPVYDSASNALPSARWQPIQIPGNVQKRVLTHPIALFSADELNALLQPANLPKFTHTSVALAHPQVKGVMLVEARDDSGLLRSEIEFLRAMAERMKMEWDQALRLALLHESLNAIHTPTVLLDSRKRIIFANQPIIDKFGLTRVNAGWQQAPQVVVEVTSSLAVINALAPSENLEMLTRIENLTEAMRGTWLRECHPVRDNRGWALIFRNRAFLFGAFELMRKIESAKDGATALQLIAANTSTLLAATSAKLRIYTLDPFRPGVLVSRYSAGMTAEHEQMLADEGIFYEDKPNSISWEAIRSKEPKVFKLTGREELDGKMGRTYFGLEYKQVCDCEHRTELEKNIGDLWIDLPLVSEQRVLGKLTISFSGEDAEHLLPDTKELIKALSVVLGDLLGRIAREVERNSQLVNDADVAMAQTAHNLWSQMTAIDGFISRYRLYESKLPELRSINDALYSFHGRTFESLRRIKDRAGPVTLRPEQTDLKHVISEALTMVLYEEGSWNWAPDALPDLLGRWDLTHWSNAFIEMAHNSRDFAKTGIPLHVTVGARYRETDSDRRLEIYYRDNGRGVPPELKNKIFHGERYRDGNGRPGKGVGLSYVRKVCEAESGTIRELGEYSQGVEIVISVPANRRNRALV